MDERRNKNGLVNCRFLVRKKGLRLNTLETPFFFIGHKYKFG